METILEQQRRLHEERERLEDAMASEMLRKINKKSSGKEKINIDHQIRSLLERSVEVADNAVKLYNDSDGLRKEEVNALSGPNEFAEFYSRLRSLKEYHRKYPNEIAEPMQMEFMKLKDRETGGDDNTNLVEFTDEEGYGKYLDLHEIYDMYLNLKGIERIDYLTYLDSFDRLFDIPKEKKNTDYKRYIQGLLDYLYGFFQRVEPLYDMEKEFLIRIPSIIRKISSHFATMYFHYQSFCYQSLHFPYHIEVLSLPKDLSSLQEDFETQWVQGMFPGWQKDASSALAHSGAHLDLSAFSSPEELASLGLDRLKRALQALGLKCGGTLEERAQRLFSTKGVPLEKLDPSLFAKSRAGKGRESTEKQKDIAGIEAQVYHLSELLGEQRQATRENVERKQARTSDELEEEDEHEEGEESESDDEETVLYNPKNLPLGWDGKPIPYWLYKLHGLNISYSCEICGNYTYRGPKAFQRHFAEWRHAHGMRCLGIPNTAHFANVTLIEDAVSLWQKLKSSKSKERWLADQDEECEDSKGNVVNRKTFEDLSRQGLL